MQGANKAAQNADHEFICSEDILIGLICNWNNAACAVLTQLSITREAITGAMDKYAPPDSARDETEEKQDSRSARKILKLADIVSKGWEDPQTGTDHLLMSILLNGEGVAFQALTDVGITSTNVEATINARRLELETPASPGLTDQEFRENVGHILADLSAAFENVSTILKDLGNALKQE